MMFKRYNKIIGVCLTGIMMLGFGFGLGLGNGNWFGFGIGAEDALAAGSWATGKFNSGYDFNDSAYISCGNVYNGVKTISFWVLADSVVSEEIIELASGVNIQVTNGDITATGITSPTVYVDGVAATAIDTNWHFVAITTATAINANAVKLGRVSTSDFNGVLDDVKLYNRVLTAREISEHYRQKAPSLAQGGTATEDVYIMNDGKLGIGTISPVARLSVVEASDGQLVDFTHGTTHMLTILDEWRTRFATSSVAYFGSLNDRVIDNMEGNGVDWLPSGSTTVEAESSIVKMGDKSLQIISNWACEDDLINKTISAEDWSAYERMGFWIYSDRIATTTATTTQMISIELIDSTNGNLAHDITIQAEDQWQYEEWALNATGTTAYDGVTDLQFRIDANTTTTNFYIDQIRLYNENERAGEFFVDGSGNLNLFSPNEIEFTRAVPGGSLPSMKLGSAIVEVNQPFAVNVAGDVGINYDLYFAGTGMSSITSAGPLRISAGDSNHAENLTLTTGNKGDIIIDIADSRFGLKTIGNSNLAYVNRLYPEGELEVRNTLFSDMKFIDVAGYYDGSTWASTTDEINSYQGEAQTLLADTNDYFYWGCTSTDGFSRLYFDLNAVATTTLNLIWEYSTSTDSIHIPAIDWPNLQGVTTTDDTANGFESDGNIDWTIPGDWGASNMGGIATTTDAFYWIRVHTDTTGWTTAPTAYFAALSRYGSDFIRMATDGTDKFRIDKDGDLYVAGKIGIATANASTSAHIISTSEQLRLAHDVTKYTQFKTDSAGDLHITATGDDIEMADDNLLICTGGNIDGSGCPLITLTGQGNLQVETNIYAQDIYAVNRQQMPKQLNPYDGGNGNPAKFYYPCPPGYIQVPGNPKYNTSDFCVMKYEAKECLGAGTATTTDCSGGETKQDGAGDPTTLSWAASYPENRPWVSIQQDSNSAQLACENMGPGFHLITNAEWMTIADNIIHTRINDLDKDTSLYQLATGHSKVANTTTTVGTAGADPVVSGCNLNLSLENSANDYSAASCELQGDGTYGPDDNDKGYYGTSQNWSTTYTPGAANASQLRTHVLSNGAVIWDLAGNVWEWTDDVIDTENTANLHLPTPSTCATESDWRGYFEDEIDACAGGPESGYLSNAQGLNIIPNISTTYTGTSYGIGRIYIDIDCAYSSVEGNDNCGVGDHYLHAFLRGGDWGNGANAGVFTLALADAPSRVNTNFGFRCAR